MRGAAGDDLEALPVDLPAATAPTADAGHAWGGTVAPAATTSRGARLRATAVVIAVVAVVAATTAVIVLNRRADDPATDAGAIVAAWARADAAGDAADRASVRVRVLVPTADIDTTFRALSAVRDEERRRLAAALERLDGVDTRDDDVERARDTVRRAIALRERRAGLLAEFYADGAVGVRNFEGVERGIALTGRDARRESDALRQGFDDVGPRTAPDLDSPALQRALGRYGRVVDAPLGARLLLLVDGVVLELDPDAGASGRTEPMALDAVALMTAGDGTVVGVRHNGDVATIATPDRSVARGNTIGRGDPIPSTRPDAVWLATEGVARQVTLDGTTLPPVLVHPADQVVVGATTAGLVVMELPDEGAPTVGLLSPPGGDIRELGAGWFVAARGDTLVTSPCEPGNPVDCTLHVTDVGTGDARTVLPPGDGEWRYEQGSISPDGRWLAVGATSTGVDGGLLFVDLATLRTRLIRVATQATDTPHNLVWDERNRVFALDRRNGAMWARPGDAEVHPIRLPVAFDRPVRVDALAVVPG